MSMSGPEAPDYRGAAEEQGQASQAATTQQTWANRPTLNTPWGSMSWEAGQQRDPATGQMVTSWTGNLGLTPDQQSALDSQQRMQLGRSQMAEGLIGQTGEQLGTPLDFASAGQARQAGEDAIYGRMSSRLDPQWGERERALESRLISQGLQPGTEAYDNAMGDLGRQRTDAYSDAMYRAIEGGGNEAARQQGLDLGARTGSLNLMNAAINGQQVAMPQMPGFSLAGQAQTPQYLAAANAQYQAGLDQYNARNSMAEGLLPGAGPFLFGGR